MCLFPAAEDEVGNPPLSDGGCGQQPQAAGTAGTTGATGRSHGVKRQGQFVRYRNNPENVFPFQNKTTRVDSE